jgi:hypothetical protein
VAFCCEYGKKKVQSKHCAPTFFHHIWKPHIYIYIYIFIYLFILRNPYLWRRSQASRKSIFRSAVQLLPNYCQENLLVKSCYLYVGLHCRQKLKHFLYLFVSSNLSLNMKSWTWHQSYQMPDKIFRDISRDVWNFLPCFIFCIYLLHHFSRNPRWKKKFIRGLPGSSQKLVTCCDECGK